jgi:hypothetical protein
MILLRDAGLDEQTNEQKKAQAAIRYSLFKVQCSTIHLSAPFVVCALVFYQNSTGEPILYFVAPYSKSDFSLCTT